MLWPVAQQDHPAVTKGPAMVRGTHHHWDRLSCHCNKVAEASEVHCHRQKENGKGVVSKEGNSKEWGWRGWILAEDLNTGSYPHFSAHPAFFLSSELYQLSSWVGVQGHPYAKHS